MGVATAGSNGGIFTINSDGSYIFNPGTDFLDLANGESRNTSITYTIDDGNGGTDQATFTVTVNGSNNAPVIIDPAQPVTDPNNPPVPADPNNFIPDQSGSDSMPLTPFDISPYFHDFEGDPITFGLDAGAPPWLSIDPVSGVITGTPPSDASIGGPGSDGVYVITLIGTDSNGDSVSTMIDFTITNPPPVTSGLEDQEDTAGTSFTMETAGSFSDPDGDTLTFSATGLPAGLSIDPVTGEITGIIDGGATSGGPHGNGIYTVSVTADDGQGGTVTATFTLTVADPPSPVVPVPSDPLPPVNGPGDPIILPEPNLVIGDLVNTISPLGGHTGIFDLSHPITEALYQISPLSIAPSLDPVGLPITQTIDWIERTRAHLDRNGKTAWLTDKGLRDEVAKYYLGGDAAPGGDASDPIVRTLAWGPVLFIEIVSGHPDLEWEMESVDGRAPGRDLQAYGANLFAVSRPGNGTEARFVLRGSDSDGNEILLEVDLLTTNGQLVGVRASDGEDLAQGLSDQIRKLVQARKAATRSPFLTSG